MQEIAISEFKAKCLAVLEQVRPDGEIRLRQRRGARGTDDQEPPCLRHGSLLSAAILPWLLTVNGVGADSGLTRVR